MGERIRLRSARMAAAGLIFIVTTQCSTAKNGASREIASSKEAANSPPTASAPKAPKAGELLTGHAALGDWTTDHPGVRRKLTLADLPAPYATKSVRNQPSEVDPPANALPKVPEGFAVQRFVAELKAPRMLRTAPNGDVFVAESKADRVRVLRDADGDGQAETSEVFAEDLKQPFGIAFYPPGANPTHVYIANTDSVVRFAYTLGDLAAKRAPESIVRKLPSGAGLLGGGGHWTRDIVFSSDGAKLYVSVGSYSNVDDDADEARARVFEYTPDGKKNERVYASGIRNPVSLTIHPETQQLWTAVNERDELGDHLVPDYVTHVTDGGFYGWPWFYLGQHQDPSHPDQHLDLKDKVIVPDLLLQSHSAALGMTFYTGEQFPAAYRGQAFVALHGSWNRERRTGYKVIRVPFDAGRARGEYVDFLTGFVTPAGDVWGRPVAVAVARDGALLVSDDVGNTIWRVSHSAK